MNIKNLRKNYQQLSKRERWILYDAAENRDDKAEMDAIMLATPNENWTKPDFALQAEQIFNLRLLSSVQQLKYARKAMFWLSVSFIEDHPERLPVNNVLAYEYARLNAYFYCVKVKSYKILYEELGLDCEAWEKKKYELFDLDFCDDWIDSLLSEMAFDEQEAEAFVNEIAQEYNGIKIPVVLGFTVEKEVEGMRKILKKRNFKDFFKS